MPKMVREGFNNPSHENFHFGICVEKKPLSMVSSYKNPIYRQKFSFLATDRPLRGEGGGGVPPFSVKKFPLTLTESFRDWGY